MPQINSFHERPAIVSEAVVPVNTNVSPGSGDCLIFPTSLAQMDTGASFCQISSCHYPVKVQVDLPLHNPPETFHETCWFVFRFSHLDH